MLKVVFICLLCVSAFVLTAQTPPEMPQQQVDTWGLYTGEYNLELAKDFEWAWEYEKAVWIYINMMDGPQRQAVVERVKGLKKKVGDLEVFINITFDTYANYDPEIHDMVDGKKVLNDSLYQRKKELTNQLIKAIQ